MIGYRTIASPSGSSHSVFSANEGSAIDENALIPRDPGSSLRTLEDVRDQVAHEIAIRTITKAQILDGVKIGVSFTFSKSDDEGFLVRVMELISHQLVLQEHLFAVATTAPSIDSAPGLLVICGSSESFIQKAVLIASSKFIGRVVSASYGDRYWIAAIKDIGASPYDEDALWDVLQKCTQSFDPLLPPPGSKGIDDILSESRAKLQRIEPLQALEELRESQVGAPTFLVDIRPAAQREAEGGIHGSLIIERNVLEWRFDPRSNARLAIADRYDLRVIVFCQEGYTSSLAAYSLQQLGLLNATDIIGGYRAWKEAGLPVDIETPKPGLRSLASIAGSFV